MLLLDAAIVACIVLVYSFWNEVYDYDGNWLGSAPDDAIYISELVPAENGGSVEVKYIDSGENECVTIFEIDK